MSAIALDSNLVLLLIVGQVAPSLLGRHKRLSGYDRRDFNHLVGILGRVDDIVTTPNAMSEVSNLARQGIRDPDLSRIYNALKQFAEHSNERYLPSRDAAAAPEFVRLGLTDVTWLSIPTAETPLLTDDTDLYLAALGRGFQAIKFNEYRGVADA